MSCFAKQSLPSMALAVASCLLAPAPEADWFSVAKACVIPAIAPNRKNAKQEDSLNLLGIGEKDKKGQVFKGNDPLGPFGERLSTTTSTSF
jgi:hypothetical protein